MMTRRSPWRKPWMRSAVGLRDLRPVRSQALRPKPNVPVDISLTWRTERSANATHPSISKFPSCSEHRALHIRQNPRPQVCWHAHCGKLTLESIAVDNADAKQPEPVE